MTSSNSKLLAIVIASTAFITTCSDPVCGCTPAIRSSAHLFGTVTAGSAPVPGVTVQLASSSAPACGTSPPAPAGLSPLASLTGTDGTFNLIVISFYDPASYCLRVSAVRQLAMAQDTAVLDGLTLTFRSPPQAATDSVRVDLAFP